MNMDDFRAMLLVEEHLPIGDLLPTFRLQVALWLNFYEPLVIEVYMQIFIRLNIIEN